APQSPRPCFNAKCPPSEKAHEKKKPWASARYRKRQGLRTSHSGQVRGRWWKVRPRPLLCRRLEESATQGAAAAATQSAATTQPAATSDRVDTAALATAEAATKRIACATSGHTAEALTTCAAAALGVLAGLHVEHVHFGDAGEERRSCDPDIAPIGRNDRAGLEVGTFGQRGNHRLESNSAATEPPATSPPVLDPVEQEPAQDVGVGHAGNLLSQHVPVDLHIVGCVHNLVLLQCF